MGSPGFSPGAASWISLAVHPTTFQPYASFQDANNSGKATVMSYDATTTLWATVGLPGFSAGQAGQTSLAFQPNSSVPYLAFNDDSVSYRAVVVAFDGATWGPVGSPGFSAGAADCTSLAFQPNSSVPFLAYKDWGSNSNRATVKRFTGASWVNVGSPGFSAGQAAFVSLSFQPNSSIPFIAYQDGGNSNYATVMAFNGAVWRPVGSAGFSTSSVSYTSLAFKPSSSAPYVAFVDDSASKGATVMRFDGAQWFTVGTAGFSAGQASYISIAFMPSTSMPYVSFSDYTASPSRSSTVMAFDGQWFLVGSRGFSSSEANYPSLAFRPDTPQVIVAYQDGGNSNAATVKEFSVMVPPPQPPRYDVRVSGMLH